MLELINSNPTLTLGIASPLFLAFGYLYRAKNENKKNKKLALYSLMEIWHRMSTFYIRNIDDLYERVMNSLTKKYPYIEFSKQDLELGKAHFVPLILKSLRDTSSFDLNNYQDKYQDAICLIASDDPIFAYKISSASSVDKFLNMIGTYMDSSLEGITDDVEGSILSSVLKETMTEHVEIDTIKELELNIKALARKISFGTYLTSAITIYQRERKLTKIMNEKIDEIVVDVLVPAFNEVNKQMSKKAD